MDVEIQKLPGRESWLRSEKVLDAARHRPTRLTDDRIASMVSHAIERGDKEFHRHALHVYAAMPNRVPVLVTPIDEVRQSMRALKHVTAHQTKLILGRMGQIWESRSFERYRRDDENFVKMQSYIAQNPCMGRTRGKVWRVSLG